ERCHSGAVCCFAFYASNHYSCA
ncbi:4Fe-4S binding domain protein, partial [Vibrio parahaemolyticus AQ3810]